MSKLDEFDDFSELENAGISIQDLNLSNVYNIKVGGFGKTNSLRTYLASLNVKELEQDIVFYETLSKDKSWPISQIIQREVNKIRVSNISKDYILGKGRHVKYFPPIIVALLPRGEDGTINLKLNFTPENSDQIKELIFDKSAYRNNSKMRDYFVQAPNISLVCGLDVLNISKVFDFNVLCWDKSQYYAIVIDGQHRLDSLLKSTEIDTSIQNYLQDVVFLDFAPLIKELDEELSPIEVVRRVFVDINTNARKVDFVRQILMDDKDLASLLVQSLVDSVKKDGSDKDDTQYLPSELVDWHGESLKHILPHLTGILSLHQILSDYLIQSNITSINDRRKPAKVKNWVNRLNDYFFVDKTISTHNIFSEVVKLEQSFKEFDNERNLTSSITDEIDPVYKETTLFNFDYGVLEIAQFNFEKNYSKGIVKFFKEFKPYQEVIGIVKEYGGFDKSNTLNTALLSSKNTIGHSPNLRAKLSEVRAYIESKLNGKYFLMYTVLGQKAVFNLLFKNIFKNFNNDFNEEECLLYVKNFLEDLNFVMELSDDSSRYIFGLKDSLMLDNLDLEADEFLVNIGPVTTSFWEGIIYEYDRIIYNSQGILSFSSFIDYLIALKSDLLSGGNGNIPFNISYQNQRVKRILEKSSNLIEGDYDNIVKQIIEKKREFIVEFVKKALVINKQV